MEGKTCNVCNLEKHTEDFFKKNNQKVKFVIAKEAQNVTMKTKIKYQINKKFIMKKRETNYYKNKKNIHLLKNYLETMLE